MTALSFQRQLERAANRKVKLKINDNHSTMLSVKWEPDCTKVSMHRIFLDAPKNIMDAVACHIRKENSVVAPTVKAYIEDKLRKLDYSHEIDQDDLSTEGNVYDLQAMYDEINAAYFNNKVKLMITWFGNPNHRSRSKVTFGLYFEPLRLIKIHRMMDRRFFPEYFVKFVIYHEMLHHVSPSYYDDKGRHRIHTKQFKELEKKFLDYDRAEAWLEKHHKNFFIS